MPNNHQLDYTLDLGGNHVDYAPIVDPTTDWSASQVNAIAGTVAGLSQTTPVIIANMEWSGTTPSFTAFRSCLKNITYTLTRQSTGVVDCVINLAQSTLDDRSVTFSPTTFVVSSRQSDGAMAFGSARLYATTSSTVTIRIQCYNTSFSAVDNYIHTIMVF